MEDVIEIIHILLVTKPLGNNMLKIKYNLIRLKGIVRQPFVMRQVLMAVDRVPSMCHLGNPAD